MYIWSTAEKWSQTTITVSTFRLIPCEIPDAALWKSVWDKQAAYYHWPWHHCAIIKPVWCLPCWPQTKLTKDLKTKIAVISRTNVKAKLDDYIFWRKHACMRPCTTHELAIMLVRAISENYFAPKTALINVLLHDYLVVNMPFLLLYL